MTIQCAKLIPWLPAIAAVLCGLCCMHRRLRALAGPVCILAIAGAFGLAVLVSGPVLEHAHDVVSANPLERVTGASVHLFEWVHIGLFKADFAYYLDPLTILMLFVVTGIGALVAIYASGYMWGDRGYARFFAFVSLFIFAMTTLVMADNLLLLYLGWEGVGLCSYLLIGYYYQKPSAVAAAKKAFIVNRIGDLGFAIGIFLIYVNYRTLAFWSDDPNHPGIFQLVAQGNPANFYDLLIPFLLMLGAFGKSAQLPLYVWLPDAMEGPTPVSALIHAATMVTAGVYMIARLLPVFELSPYALPTVAVVGGATAIFAATIALCQYDIKRVFAYSTVSQLGYMFLGVGVLSTVGGVFHLFTHAFFKALLFLTAGSVMHALAGQLDLRKMSGLRRKMPVTCVLMLVGCLALAGFPFTAGFFSKDMILAATLERGLGHDANATLFMVLAVVGMVTALLTAYYTFRLWFRVFMGPEQFEMGHEHHGAEEEHGHGEHDAQPEAAAAEAAPHGPHEVNWIMNAPLVVLAVGALLAGYYCEHWIKDAVSQSSAAVAGAGDAHGHGPELLGMSVHAAMLYISSVIAILGIILAAYFHWLNRAAADRLAARYAGVVRVLANKYYVDEIYDALIVRPLRLIGEVCYAFDALVIDGLVALVGWVPRAMGQAAGPTQRGALQGYGLGMVAGLAVLVLLVLFAMV